MYHKVGHLSPGQRTFQRYSPMVLRWRVERVRGVFGESLSFRNSFKLSNDGSLFQAEVFAIKAVNLTNLCLPVSIVKRPQKFLIHIPLNLWQFWIAGKLNRPLSFVGFWQMDWQDASQSTW